MFKSRRSGYSLAEVLVVIAIVGALSVVIAPNFISMTKNAKVRSAMTQLTMDFRITRQHAITRFQKSKLVFSTGGAGTRSYSIYDASTDSSGTVTWTKFGPTRMLDESVYFAAQTFNASSPASIIFQTSGGIDTTATASSTGTPYLRIRSTAKVPKNEYTFTFGAAGNFTTAASHY